MEPEEFRKQAKKWAIIGSFFAAAVVFYALGWKPVLVAYVVIVGVLAVLAILLQSGRGGGLAASLGGLGGDSLLGTHSAAPIAKATYVMLALVLFICVLTARMRPEPTDGPSLIPIPPRQGTTIPFPELGGGASTDAPAIPAAPAVPEMPAETPNP